MRGGEEKSISLKSDKAFCKQMLKTICLFVFQSDVKMLSFNCYMGSGSPFEFFKCNKDTPCSQWGWVGSTLAIKLHCRIYTSFLVLKDLLSQ